ncbi:MAG: sigma-54 dependent transcriptional regulator [Desulfuromonadales bacterium]|nr:sigma-54 dependent transcriptional regulator [Desulfuromonadales bacterium]
MNATILIVDDEESIREALQGVLEDEGYRVITAENGIDGIEAVQKDIPDLVLLDIWMPKMDGLEALKKLRELYPNLAVVMISGHGTIETAVNATKMGAFDFIEKPLSLDKVLLTVSNAVNMSRLIEENASLKGLIDDQCELVGDSAKIKELREQIKRVASADSSVLITGETGTGKELVARVIHSLSSRKDKPFISMNCAALPEELMESELFGHEKGAFPGAISQKKGKLDIANGGTLFLNNVEELSVNGQRKLLKLLQESNYERVGGTRSIKADLRIIAATVLDIEKMASAGEFLPDLYYRLNVVPLHIPALREHLEDIPELVKYFLDRFCIKEGREKKEASKDTLKALKNYDWPGNIRELKNIIERMVIMSSGQFLEISALPDMFVMGQDNVIDDFRESNSLRGAREEFEREFIMQKLEENDWNITKTAEAIELERSNLHRKIKSYGIEMKK